MKIYENRNNNMRTTHCPTCGNEGHMWMTCPVPAKMMELKKQGKEPDFSLYSKWQAQTWSRRDSHGDLIYQDRIWKKMAYELDRQKRRVEARKEKKAHRAKVAESLGIPKKKRKTSCGFCGSEDHNRRNCDLMVSFVDDLERASQNYRKLFYERFVKGMGFAEGALLALSADHFRTANGWTTDWSGIGIVTGVTWDKVNLGLSLNNWEFKSVLEITCLVNGETYKMQNPFNALVQNDTVDGKRGEIAELFARGSSWGTRIDSVLAPSENIPSEEWFNDGYTECWEWIAKNRSLSDVSAYLSPLIAQFHPSRRGRNAGRLNYRLSQYGYTRPK